MSSMILLSALLIACRGEAKDTGKDSFRPAINEASNRDRVGTYAHTLPIFPETVIFLGDSITAGAGAGNDDEDYASLLVNNSNTWPDWDGIDLATRYPDIDVVDVSNGGAWTGTVLNDQIDRLEEQVSLPLAGETLVVNVGGNDLQSVLLNPSEVEQRLENGRQLEKDCRTLPRRGAFP